MKRRGFFKSLSLGVVATVVAPMMLRGQGVTISDTPVNKNPIIILKDSYRVTGGVATDIKWVKVGDNYLWYNYKEVEVMNKFQDMMESKILKL